MELSGYLPDYRIARIDPRVIGRLYDEIILFSIEPRPDGSISRTRLSEDDLRITSKLKSTGVSRVLVTVGGGGRSKAFNAATNDRASRTRLVQGLLSFCRTHKLDGVDYDWEIPQNPGEQRQYEALIEETRSAFAPHKLRVSAAVALRQRLSPEAIDALDSINLMAYDGPGQHASMDFARLMVWHWQTQDVPPAKLRLGVPFYARGVVHHGRAVPFTNLAEKHDISPDMDQVGDYYFNGEKTLQAKTEYAAEQQLGGMMVWEIGQDQADMKLSQALATGIAQSTATAAVPPRKAAP